MALVALDNTQVNMAANLGPNTSGKTKWLHLNISSHVQTQLVFLSGKTGVLIGSKVVLNSTETTNHLLHHGATGSQYVLLQMGLCPNTASRDTKTHRRMRFFFLIPVRLLLPRNGPVRTGSVEDRCQSQTRDGGEPQNGQTVGEECQSNIWACTNLWVSLSLHRAHICLAIIPPFNENWLLAQIGLLETRAESGTRRGNSQPAASHWKGGGTPEWENVAITVEVQYQLSPQVFFRVCVRYHLIRLQYLMCCSVNGCFQVESAKCWNVISYGIHSPGTLYFHTAAVCSVFFMQGTLFWTL